MGSLLDLNDVASGNPKAEKELEEFINYPESIQNYKQVLLSLIEHAELESQRQQLGLLVQLFKNKFKKEPTLIKFVWDIENKIEEIKNAI